MWLELCSSNADFDSTSCYSVLQEQPAKMLVLDKFNMGIYDINKLCKGTLSSEVNRCRFRI